MGRATTGTQRGDIRSAARTSRRGKTRGTIRRITANTFESFADLRPDWAESLFDLHFLLHSGAPTLRLVTASATDQSTAADEASEYAYAEELARAYAAQWGFGAERTARLVEEVLPACHDFLRIFVNTLNGAQEAATSTRARSRPSLLNH